MKPSWTRQLRALLLKDLRLELRTRDTVVAMLLFAVAAMVVFQFGFGTRGTDLTRFAGGLLWVTLALTAILGVFITRPRAGENGLKTINRSFYISAAISGVSGAPAQSTSCTPGSKWCVAATKWPTPFCRVIRPTKDAIGALRSTPFSVSTERSSVGW